MTGRPAHRPGSRAPTPSPLRPAGSSVRLAPARPPGGPASPVRIDALNAETAPAALRTAVTPARGFFVRSHFPAPLVRASSWTLAVTGEVARPRSWTLDELRTLPQSRLVATLECAGNSRKRLSRSVPGELPWGDHAVGTAVWKGVPLSALLEAAAPLPGAEEVVFTGADTGSAGPVRRFSRSLTGDLSQNRDVLVATEMNDAPLSTDHGWPARLVVPGWYGMAWVKWLTRIQLQHSAFQGHYQASRYIYQYHRDGKVVREPVTRLRVKSLVLSPAPGERLARRPHVVSGRAWSGSGPIRKVEVNVGAGWTSAQLTPGNGPYDWSGWEYVWSPEQRGRATVRVRATDATGATQPAAPEENDFQYGINSVHSVQVTIA